MIWEMQFAAVTITLGIFLSVCYDLIRIFRRVISHGTLWIALEDILFWACCGLIVFVVSFWENDGNLRWYTVAGVAFGAYLYHETVSAYLVRYLSRAINFPLNILKKELKKLRISYRIKAECKGGAGNGKEEKEESI